MKDLRHSFALVLGLLILASCRVQRPSTSLQNFQYEKFKASFVPGVSDGADTSNFLDTIDPVNASDSLHNIFATLGSFWKEEKHTLTSTQPIDRTEKQILKSEIAVVNDNIKALASYSKNNKTSKKSACVEKECPLVAEVVKSKQIMYLYIAGSLKDSFAVSTGIPSRETPNMNVRPAGPLFIKYTSTKYPEGNYMGLGNMPYAVFVKGGYAIHGTTQGNFAKLGRKASHGCIRLHPDNAKFFYELVKLIGLNNTWVIVR